MGTLGFKMGGSCGTLNQMKSVKNFRAGLNTRRQRPGQRRRIASAALQQLWFRGRSMERSFEHDTSHARRNRSGLEEEEMKSDSEDDPSSPFAASTSKNVQHQHKLE